jgi:hypothetical protein
MSYAGASIAGGGAAARGRSRSFGSRSINGADGAGVFVRAGADNEMYVRADKIDFKNLDVQLEKTRSQVWLERQRSQRSASPRPETPLLEWEIDLAKLDIQNQIAHGTFGVVYRGTYDGHDVAGTSVHTAIITSGPHRRRTLSMGVGPAAPHPSIFEGGRRVGRKQYAMCTMPLGASV